MATFILLMDLQFGHGMVAMVISVPLGINLGGSKTGLKSSEDTLILLVVGQSTYTRLLVKLGLPHNVVAGF